MSIKVLFFASLRDTLGRASDVIDAANISTVADVWEAVAKGDAMPSNLLMAINQDYVKADASVQDNDEVAFFPPVTGG